MSSDLTQAWLSQNVQSYPNKDSVFNHIHDSLRRFSSLRPKSDVYTFDDGRSQLLLCVHGLLTIRYRQASYNIPLAVWLPREYPREPPLVYVVPTADMLVRPGPHLDPSGRCNHPYLQHWARKSEGCNLSSLLEDLQDQFSHEPPVYAKPPPAAVRPTGQSTASSPPPVPARPAHSPLSHHHTAPLSPPKPPPPPRPASAHHADAYQAALHQQQHPVVPTVPPPPPQQQPLIRGSPVPVHHASQHHVVGPTNHDHHRQSYHPAYAYPVQPQQHLQQQALNAHTAPPPPPPPPLPPTFQPPNEIQGQGSNTSVQYTSAPLTPAITTSTTRSQPVPNLLDDDDESQSYAGMTNAAAGSPQGHLGVFSPSPSSTTTLGAPPSLFPSHPGMGGIGNTGLLPPTASPTSPAPPPIRPPNPELLALHAAVHTRLTSELHSLSSALALDAERLRAHQNDLLAGEPAVRDEMARLEAVRDVCRGVAERTRGVVRQAEEGVRVCREKGEVGVDEVVCAMSIVHNQLINLVAEDNAIEDTIYHLHRALNSGRIDLERFLRTTRVLAEEQFMKRALIDKIQVGVSRLG